MAGISAYQQTSIETESKGRIVVKLYDGAIRFLRKALEAINTGDFEQKGNLIIKARNIVLELSAALDMEAGGEIAQNLRSLYNFILHRLTIANIKCDKVAIEEVINLLANLNAGWKKIA